MLCRTSRAESAKVLPPPACDVLHERDGTFAHERHGYGVGAHAVASGASCGVGGVEEDLIPI